MNLNQPYWSTIVDLEEFLNPRRVKLFRWENLDRKIITQRGASVPDSFLYPSIKCNKVFLYELTETKPAKDLFSPIEFFNLLYNCLEIILANLNNREELCTWQWIKDREPDRNRYQYLVKSLFYLVCELNRMPWMLPGNLTNEALAAEPVSERIEDITMDIGFEIKRLERDQAESRMDSKPTTIIKEDSKMPALKNQVRKKGFTHEIVLYYIYENKYFGDVEAKREAEIYSCHHGSLLSRYDKLKYEHDRTIGDRGQKAFDELAIAMENVINSRRLSAEGLSKASRELIALKNNRNNFQKKNID